MPGIVNPKGKGKSKPRIRPSIHKDRVNPTDFLTYDTRFSCEDCTHFASETVTCTLGYQTFHHLKATQAHQYELAGNMAFCRFIEID